MDNVTNPGPKAVLAILDELKDEAAAHMYPDDLERFSRSECTATAFSVRVGCPDGKSVPLFSREQVAKAIADAGSAPAPEIAILKEQLRACVTSLKAYQESDSSQTNDAGRKRVNEALELDLRISSVMDFASLLATGAFDGGSVPDELADLIEWLASDGRLLHASLAAIARVFAEFPDDLDFAGEQLVNQGVSGLAVKVSTPVREYRSGISFRSSWGYYTSTWVYADSLDEAWTLGVEWAKAMHTGWLAKFNAGKGASA